MILGIGYDTVWKTIRIADSHFVPQELVRPVVRTPFIQTAFHRAWLVSFNSKTRHVPMTLKLVALLC